MSGLPWDGAKNLESIKAMKDEDLAREFLADRQML